MVKEAKARPRGGQGDAVCFGRARDSAETAAEQTESWMLGTGGAINSLGGAALRSNGGSSATTGAVMAAVNAGWEHVRGAGRGRDAVRWCQYRGRAWRGMMGTGCVRRLHQRTSRGLAQGEPAAKLPSPCSTTDYYVVAGLGESLRAGRDGAPDLRADSSESEHGGHIIDRALARSARVRSSAFRGRRKNRPSMDQPRRHRVEPAVPTMHARPPD